MLSISDTPTEALWLVSARTERAFRSLQICYIRGWDDSHQQLHLFCPCIVFASFSVFFVFVYLPLGVFAVICLKPSLSGKCPS